MAIRPKADEYAKALLEHDFTNEETLVDQIGRVVEGDRLLVPTEEDRPRTHPQALDDGVNSYPFKYYLGSIQIEFVMATNLDKAHTHDEIYPFVELHPVYVWDDGKEFWWGMYTVRPPVDTVVSEAFDKMIEYLSIHE